ncbi:hypothetical protein SUDANB145_07010 [Streptomyces sp. enrichment culture]|uniref:mycothiol transferase n=1 Tax=Streptomyces sp. enrichment culture TaxID=1795815 RepID=UPI003F5598A7
MDFHRATLALTCAGLRDDEVRPAAVALSSLTPLWRAEVARGRGLVAGASPDDRGRRSARDAGHVGGDGVSLRWILVRLIEEYARHNGHADLVRERVDGVTGA